MQTEIGASIFPWTKPASSHVGQPRAILEPTITHLSGPSADIPLERVGKGSHRAGATVVLRALPATTMYVLHDTTPAPSRTAARLPGEPKGNAGGFKASFQAARRSTPSFGIPGMRCLSQD